jgi:salicylate hydroxylase
VILFPPFQLIELEDLLWTPPWLHEYAHLMLARVWHTHGLFRSETTASQACDIILSNLSSFVDCCAGSCSPTPILEEVPSGEFVAQGKQAVPFALADWYPHLDVWQDMVKRSGNIRYIDRPMDATSTTRYVATNGDTRECRMFNLCFHHFDDDDARKVLRSVVAGGEAFTSVLFGIWVINFVSSLTLATYVASSN